MKQRDIKHRKKRERQICLLLTVCVILGGCLIFQKLCRKDNGKETTSSKMTAEEKETNLPTENVPDSTETVEISAMTEDSEIVEAAALLQEYQRISSLPAGNRAAFGMVKPELVNQLFHSDVIDDGILARINGKSYTENENIELSQLSYLKMLYYGIDGNTYVGEMIVNKEIASDVLDIFRQLYENQYPIERMVLIDEYNAEDETSMENNNTSAFNYRTISGSNKLSNHSFGMAIDLNPKYNPYVKITSDGSMICQPQSGIEYADRTKDFLYKIDENDLAYRLFTQAGFTWGGSWKNVKDYQHFEKE